MLKSILDRGVSRKLSRGCLITGARDFFGPRPLIS